MISRLPLLSLLLLLAIVSGCGAETQRMIRVTIDYPGTSPQDVADFVAHPVEMTLIGLPAIDSITSISSAGRFESYIVIAREGRTDEVLARITETLPGELLPAETSTPKVELLPASATIPVVHPANVDFIAIEVDREAVAKYAIPIGNVHSAIEEQAGGSASDMSRLEKLRTVQVTAPGETQIPLTQLAKIEVEKQPSQIVTRWPPGE